MRLRDWPIERKFLVGALFITLPAIAFLAVFLIVTESTNVRRARLASAEVFVAMIATNSAAALWFDDAQVATQVLSGIAAERATEAAALYDSDGKLFAYFPTHLPASAFPAGSELPRNRYSAKNLELSSEVLHNGRRAGTAYLRMNLADTHERFRTYVVTVAVVAALAVLLVLALSKVLQRWIVKPLISLSETARAVAKSGDYSLRARKTSGDQVGDVVDAFNQMLDVTQRSQAHAQAELAERRKAEDALREAQVKLAEHATRLEETVAERTARLVETVGELEAFSYSIAHDMRAPLRSMVGFSGLLSNEYGSKLDDLGRDYLRRISASASRLDRLIQDVLNYSKVVRGELRLESVDALMLLREIIESYPNLQPPDARIVICEPIPRLHINPAAFTQVASNLLGNAVKFVAPGVTPEVRVWAEDKGPLVRLWFEDNGIGIEAEVIPRLFQMFQRGHRPEAYDGTGMGLAIVRKAVERMGGTVGVDSAPGRGSRFWVELQKADLA